MYTNEPRCTVRIGRISRNLSRKACFAVYRHELEVGALLAFEEPFHDTIVFSIRDGACGVYDRAALAQMACSRFKQLKAGFGKLVDLLGTYAPTYVLMAAERSKPRARCVDEHDIEFPTGHDRIEPRGISRNNL